MSAKFKASIFNGLTFKQFTGVKRVHILNGFYGVRIEALEKNGCSELHLYTTDGELGHHNDKYLGIVQIVNGKVIFEPA